MMNINETNKKEDKSLHSLAGITVLECLSTAERSELEQACIWRHCQPGEFLFTRGSHGSEVFFLVAGEVEIIGVSSSGSEFTLARVGAGTTIGEMAAIDGQPRSASVIVSKTCILAVLDGDKFSDLLKHKGEIGIALLTRFSSMVRTGDDNFVKLRVHNERIQTELGIAHNIQMSMVPLIFPAFPDCHEFTIFAELLPAREVGGDFYDFFFVDEDRLCLCIGDVSGKGVPAALFMAVAKTLIKSRATDDISTASILTHVNNELSINNNENMFVTLFVAIINTRTGEVVYTNAGHNAPYIMKKGAGLHRLEERHGPIAGVMDGLTFGEDATAMSPGDILFLYTDGVTEAVDSRQELFSDERLEALLQSSKDRGAKETVDRTVAAIREFEGGAEQTDDITIMAFQYHGSLDFPQAVDLNFTITNEISEISRLNAVFESFAETNGIPNETVKEINIVLDEIVSNIIKYAYQGPEQHEIVFHFELVSNRLIVSAIDSGVPFNPLNIPKPDIHSVIDEREIGGLGIHLVRSFVDDAWYCRKTGENVLTLVKSIT